MKEAIIRRMPRMLAAGVLCAASYYVGKREADLYYYTTMFLCPLSVLFILFQIKEILKEIRAFRRLFARIDSYLLPLKKRLKSLWRSLVKSLTGSAKNSAMYKKIEYFHLKDLSRITGYSDEYIPINNEEEKLDYDLRQLKWKKCTTNAERVRVLYIKYILRKRKNGSCFQNSDTPMQIQSKWGRDDYNEQLFPDYYKARYAIEDEIADKEIERLLQRKQTFEK